MEKMICTAACAARVFAKANQRMRVLAAFIFAVLSVFGASASGAVSVTYSFNAPRVVAGADSSTVTVAGCDPFSRTGEPVLPFRTARILIPDGQTVQSVSFDLPGKQQPITVAPPLAFGRSPVPVGIPDHPAVAQAALDSPLASIYSSDVAYPANPVELVSVQQMNGYAIAIIRIFPVQYRPVSGQLLFSRQITVNVNLAVAPLAAAAATETTVRPAWAADKVAAFVDNPESVPAQVSALSAGVQPLAATYDYLLVTTYALKAAFQPLVDQKVADGLNVKVEAIEYILANYTGKDNAEKLRNYIKYAYSTWGIQYVLLGGGASTVPFRGAYGYCTMVDNAIPSDLYFACLDGSWNSNGNTLWGEPTDGKDIVGGKGDVDMLAEVYVGRAPVATAAEATNFVNKIIKYETSGPANPGNVRLLGEWLGNYSGYNSQGGNSLDTLLPSFSGYQVDWLDDRPTNAATWGASQCVAALNKAPHLVAHDGHANQTYAMRMSTSNVASLTNTDPFLVNSIGCECGAFDNFFSANQACMAEELVKGQYGAFAVLMNSRYGWFSTTQEWKFSGEFVGRFFNRALVNGNRNIGKANQLAKQDMIGSIETSGDMVYRWCYFEITLFGDPHTPIWVSATPIISTASPLPDTLVSTAYSNTIGAIGGTKPYTWALTGNGTLPAGLTLNATTGVIDGTPTTVGSSTFTLQVTDHTAQTATKAFTLAIVTPAAPKITTGSPLTASMVGTTFSQTLAATGGTKPYTWDISAGTLPPGLSMSSDGIVAGTPTAVGNSTFTVRVTDANSYASTKVFAMSVAQAPSTVLFIDLGTDPGWTTTGEWNYGIPTGAGGTSYGYNDPTSGATGSNVYGINLTGDYSLTAGDPQYLTTTALNLAGFTAAHLRFKRWLNADMSPFCTDTVEVSNDGTTWTNLFTNPTDTAVSENAWSTQTYALPAAMDNQPAVYIRWGHQIGSGAYVYSGWNIDDIEILGTAMADTAPTITTSNPLPSGATGIAYSRTLTASGGTIPYTWAVTSGSLPTGFTLTSAGVLAGTSNTSATSNFTVTVTGNNTKSSTKNFTLKIAAAPTITSNATLAQATIGVPYTQTLTTSGGTTPFTWSLSAGSLPPGLTLNGTTGVIAGTVGTAATSSFTVRVTDALGLTATKAFALSTVAGAVPFPDAMNQPTLAFTFSGNMSWVPQTITTHDGVAAAKSGAITKNQTSGTQTTVTGPGTFSFWWKVSCEIQNDFLKFSIDNIEMARITGEVDWQQMICTVPSGTHTLAWVYSKDASVDGGEDAAWLDELTLPAAAAPTITTANPLPAGSLGTAYSQTLAAIGGTTPQTWSISAGSLPSGLSLNSNGTITGIPGAAMTANFTVMVAGGDALASTKAFSLTINSVLPEAIDQPSLAVTTSGNLPWIAQSTVTHDGVDAAMSGPIGSSQNSTMQITATGNGTASFWWKVSSEIDFDVLTFSVDNIEKARISGEVDWVQKSYTLTSGNHTLKWSYVKDGNTSDGSDCGWVDQVVAPHGAAPTITNGSALPDATVGSAYSQTLAATGGKTPYTWSLSAGSLPDGFTLNATTGLLAGTPTAATIASFGIQVTGSDSISSTANFTLTVSDAPSAPSGYSSWAAGQFTTGDVAGGLTGPTADFDGDGLPNLLEYAFGTNPKTADSPGIVADVVLGKMSISFSCDTACTDITYTVQSSSTLAAGSWTDIATSTGGAKAVPSGSLSTVSDTGTGRRIVKVTDSTDIPAEGKRFLRVRVTIP